MSESVTPCKRCLLNEMDDAALYQTIREYIENIPKTRKTPSDRYTWRLGVCTKCDNLLNGMCKLCGCFVEFRAAMAEQTCPAKERYWEGDR